LLQRILFSLRPHLLSTADANNRPEIFCANDDR